MTIKLVANVIKTSIANDKAEVVGIFGPWGVGKTYAWKHYLEAASKRGDIALQNYSYVSLFGLTNLDDVKAALFENVVGTDSVGVKPGLDTLWTNTRHVMSSTGRGWIPSIVNALPVTRNYGSGLSNRFMYMSVKKTLVCIDDIERRSKNLSMRDVLGLVSDLKLQKECKVFLIFNDDAEDEEKKDLKTFYEKVIDRALRFAPTPSEAVEIALSGAVPYGKELAAFCVELGVSNIRVIKRMEDAIEEIKPLLHGFDEGVMREAVRLIALMCWCRFDTKVAPPLEFLESQGRRSGETVDFQPGTEQARSTPTKEQAKWKALLNAYGFYMLDDFSVAIADGIRNGYFDPDAVRRPSEKMDARCKQGKSEDSLRQAWSLYHDSYENNEHEVALAIYSVTMENLAYTRIVNIDATLEVLKACGRSDLANALLRDFIPHINSGPLDVHDVFRSKLQNEDLKLAIASIVSGPKKKKDAVAILTSITDNNGWHAGDTEYLADLNAEEYYNMLKLEKGPSLAKITAALIDFHKFRDKTPEMEKIIRNSSEAMVRIGKESPLNAIRVRRYGIEVPTCTESKADSLKWTPL